ncbi:diguanylate cyclase [Jannaschia pagri]|uniref:dihydroneopterin aldolase n=1 Tax=Jannaschia pagri TaxID=2829797 RepID=A0ABQ4NGK5_9RHOB|nr:MULTISPECIES: dihydroneopterin aldolase [unclassified Jannaschia]GIT90348.1 diguanylate cyclase [Jannaschia sp. AI_61]GIT93546.1 diguanylate cyclase [Jannaschia sp. AI_62]
MPADDTLALGTAFSSPLDRARQDTATHPLDRIVLRDHVRSVEIGAFQQERGVTQRIRFDIVTEVSLDADAVAGDDVDGILSYDTLLEAVEAELAAERVNLLETLAERVAARVLLHDRAARVFVRIEKLDRGPFVLGVEIVRSRVQAPVVQAPEAPPPQPHVVLLRPGLIADPGTAGMIDRLAAGPTPAIVIVAPDVAPPQAMHPAAQRRIDLLALDQAGWQLAACDPRCVVIDTRTELDWALRHGNLSVWAPARMVLDATDSPDGADPEALALWLAGTFDAVQVTCVGDGPHPAGMDCVASPSAL